MTRRTVFLSATIGLAVVVAVLISLSVSSPATAPATVTIEGVGLSTFQGDPQSDVAVGTRAPVVVGTDFDGGEVTIGDGPAALVFLAHWCSHCQAEVPEVVAWLQSGGLTDGVALVGIATAEDPLRANHPPDAWLERENWPAPILVDDAQSSAAAAYGVSGFPYWVFIDADGNVAARVSGRLDTGTLNTVVSALAAAP